MAPLSLITFVTAGYCAWLWHTIDNTHGATTLRLKNPLQLTSALQFGLLLAAIMLLAEAFRAWLGEAGIYLLATLVNTLVKGILVFVIAGSSMAKHFAPGLILMLATGVGSLFLLQAT